MQCSEWKHFSLIKTNVRQMGVIVFGENRSDGPAQQGRFTAEFLMKWSVSCFCSVDGVPPLYKKGQETNWRAVTNNLQCATEVHLFASKRFAFFTATKAFVWVWTLRLNEKYESSERHGSFCVLFFLRWKCWDSPKLCEVGRGERVHEPALSRSMWAIVLMVEWLYKP